MQKTTIGASGSERVFEPLWVPQPHASSPIWARMGRVFSVEHFLNPALPVQLGKIARAGVGPQEGPRRYLRAHVKAAGSNRVRWPSELDPIWPVARVAFETAAAHCQAWTSSWAHITWEAGWVEPGHTQRVGGWHVDGFQGARQEPHASEFSMLWADALPTRYCPQPFFISHLDRSRHNAHAEFERQAREANAMDGEAGGIYLIDPYVVHRAAPASERLWRNVVRVTIASDLLEDPNNTVNAALGVDQAHAERVEARDRLWSYGAPPPWEMYGLRPSEGPAG